MAEKRTPSQTLIAALEEFGADEPAECLVIFTTQGGDICTMSSTDLIAVKLGMLEMVKTIVMEDIRGACER